jgi:hypothetical protein
MKTKNTQMGHSRKQNAFREWLNGTLTLSSGGSSIHQSWMDYVTTGDSVPNWKRQIALGYDATTYLEGERRTRSTIPGRLYHRFVGKFAPFNVLEYETLGPLSDEVVQFPSDPASLSTVEAERKALTRFNSRAREVNQTFQGGVFLGELGQTLRGIRHPAKSLYDGLASYRGAAISLRAQRLLSRAHVNSLSNRVKRQSLRSANEAIAGLWLEGQFHWKPLLHDIDDGLKTLANLSSSPLAWQNISASAHDVTTQVFTGLNDLGNHGVVSQTDVYTYDGSYRLKGAIGIEPRNSNIPTLENLGLAMMDFVPTVWELMPYSFVADYFSNIGDVINGWSGGGRNVRWACATTRKDGKHVRTLTLVAKPPDNVFRTLTNSVCSPPKEVATWTRVSRDTYRGNYRPSLSWEVPGLSMKWLNLGALLSARSIDRLP